MRCTILLNQMCYLMLSNILFRKQIILPYSVGEGIHTGEGLRTVYI